MASLPSGLLRGAGRAAAAASDQASTFGYLSGWRLVRLLPERQAQAVFRALADQIYRRGGTSVDRLRANLRVVRPELPEAELDALTHEAVRSYLRYWCESCLLYTSPSPRDKRQSRMPSSA